VPRAGFLAGSTTLEPQKCSPRGTKWLINSLELAVLPQLTKPTTREYRVLAGHMFVLPCNTPAPTRRATLSIHSSVDAMNHDSLPTPDSGSLCKSSRVQSSKLSPSGSEHVDQGERLFSSAPREVSCQGCQPQSAALYMTSLLCLRFA